MEEGCRVGRAGARVAEYRLRMASSRSHTTLTFARRARSGIVAPARGGEKLLGSVNRRGGWGGGRGHRPAEPGGPAGRRYLCRGERAAAAMVFPSCTGGEGRTGGQGLGAGRRRRERPEARPAAGGVSLTSTPLFVQPLPNTPPARHRPRRHPNPGAGVFAAGPEPAPGAA